MYFPEAFGIDMGVNLRGRDVAMPEQFLDDAQIGAAPQKVTGEAMTEYMRTYLAKNSGLPGVLFHQHPEADPVKRLAGSGDEQEIGRFGLMRGARRDSPAAKGGE